MTSKSTSIGDLPSVSTNDTQDEQETMMVNSILKEIENDDDIDNSENAINYTMDTSQIPPKINEQMPTREIIEETTKEIFQQPILPQKEEPAINISNNIMEPTVEIKDVEKNELSNLLKNETKKEEDTIVNKILNKGKYVGIIFILFIIFSIPQLNKLIVKYLPKMASNSPQISMMGILFKAILLSISYSIIIFFV